MIKHIIFIAGYLFIGTTVQSQHTDPVHFNYTSIKTGEKTYTLHITASIDKGWHIYALIQPKSAISIPTRIVFIKNPLIVLLSKLKEFGRIEKQTIASIGIEQYMFEKTVEYVQEIKLKANVKTKITGNITYQSCTDKECLPVKTIPFSITIQ